MSIREVQDAVRKLEKDKKITVIELATEDSFRHYLTRADAGPFFWLHTIPSAVFLAAAYLNPSFLGSWSCIFRATACGLYLAIMPGSAFTKLLLPSRDNKDLFEQTILGIGFSLALVSITAMMIYYS